MQTINSDLLISAIITTILIIFILVVIQRKLDLPGRIFYFSIIAGLPLSYLINQIKLPILNWLFTAFPLNLEFGTIWVLFVGISEEGTKFLMFIVILNILKHYKVNSYRNTVVVAYCVGIGFGIGEIWYLASLLIFSHSPIIAGIGWLAYLGGFGFERFFVTFAHAALFIVIMFGIRKNHIQIGIYLLLAMILHALYDLPIILNAIGLITSLELSLIIVLELVLGFLLSFYLLDYFLRYQDPSKRLVQKNELLKRAQVEMK